MCWWTSYRVHAAEKMNVICVLSGLGEYVLPDGDHPEARVRLEQKGHTRVHGSTKQPFVGFWQQKHRQVESSETTCRGHQGHGHFS